MYELLTGARPFRGNSSVEILSAIIKEDPPNLLEQLPQLPPTLARVIERCLEKDPDNRFQNAADLRFALEQSSGTSATPAFPAKRQRRARWAIAAAAIVALAAVGTAIFGDLRRDPVHPAFEQLTFRRGTIHTARFASDGKTIVYAAGWEGRPFELFTTRPDSREARALQMTNMGLFGVSAKDEMAVAIGASGFGYVNGTLARAPLAGGVPREVADGVTAADWSPDGSELAFAATRSGETTIEFPAGHVIYKPTGNVSHIRVSPSGDSIAAIVHPVTGDAAGEVVVIDRNGTARTLTTGWNSVLGVGWSPTGQDVWFTGTRTGSTQALHAVSLQGEERLLLSAPATLTLHDVSRDGRALISRDAWGAGVIRVGPRGARDQELSWLDGTTAWDVSDDGGTLLIEEAWEGGGASRSIYLRTTDGAPALRLGEGVPLALSHNRDWVLSTPVSSDRMTLLPTKAGQPRVLPSGPVASYFPAARWLPGDREFLFSGSAANERPRVFLQSIDSGDPKPITQPGEYGRLAIYPEGGRFITRGAARELRTFSIADGSSQPVKGALIRDQPIVISSDRIWLYVQGNDDHVAEVARVNLLRGTREVIHPLLPADPAGVTNILRVVATPDGQLIAYTYVRALSSLYLVGGLQ